MSKPVYAGYPTAFVYAEPDYKSGRIGHLLWGTWIEHQEEEQGDWAKVRIRGWDENRKRKIGWMRKDEYQENKLLEVYFVDVGQGDGCLMITPDDKFHLVDAGESDNMANYLRWKFNLTRFAGDVEFENVIVSHPDSDHYYGFNKVLDYQNIKFKNVYHNGLVERRGDNLLGNKDGKYFTEIVVDKHDLAAVIDDDNNVGRKWYPSLMRKIRDNGANINMLCSEDEFLPGFENDKEITIKVLSPVPEADDNGNRIMRSFKGGDGKTKNGHSIVLKLEYGKVKILLGGDLNIPAEEYLLEHYTGIDPETDDEIEQKNLLEKAKEVFGVDVAKACHHGSADFLTTFLKSLNTTATVISSGDEEQHAHPRPDAVGAFGKYGRGKRPLIFSTELGRSTKDLIIEAKGPSKNQIGRTVAVYGMIDLRTDGKKVVLAQKLEQSASRGDWDYYVLEPNADGVLEYTSKHD